MRRASIEGLRLVLRAGVHSSSALWGRKSGAGAFDVSYRELSKKQKRRKVRATELLALSKDPKKAKLRAALLKKQFESPEMKVFIDQTTKVLSDGLKDLMLPDGYVPGPSKSVVNSLEKGTNKCVNPTETLLQLQMWISGLEDCESAGPRSLTSRKISSIIFADAVLPVKPYEANLSLALFIERHELNDAEEILRLMQRADIPVLPKVCAQSMSRLCRENQPDKAEKMFDGMVSLGIEPDSFSWTALVRAQALLSMTITGANAQVQAIDKAMQTLNRMKHWGLATAPMYTSVLHALVRTRSHDLAYDLWERMHAEPSLSLTLEAFTVMLKLCAQTREVERAFFYMDEMRTRGIQPDAVAFAALFRACAGVPHWVNGYQNMIFDAMALMEGYELNPTVEIYNAIIYSLGKAGDAAAAEFYFWEMQNKGLVPTLATYCSLLDAYAKSNSVGASKYGTRARYATPHRKSKSAEELDFSDLSYGEGGDGNTSYKLKALPDSEEDELIARRRSNKVRDVITESPESEIERMIIAGLGAKDNLAIGEFLKDPNLDQERLLSVLDAVQASEEKHLNYMTSNRDFEDEPRPDSAERCMDSKSSENDGAEEQSCSVMFWSRANRKIFVDPFQALRPYSAQSSSATTVTSLYDHEEQRARKNALALLDGRPPSSPPTLISTAELECTDEDDAWRLVEFGRAPGPDYTVPLPLRQAIIIRRAELCFEHMTTQHCIQPDVTALTSLLSVYSEALKDRRAEQVLACFSPRGLIPDQHTYRALIRMWIRKGDMARALALKDEMQSRAIVGDGVLYGMLIEALTHRELLAEALLLLEFCADSGVIGSGPIRVPERFVRMLRSRCARIGVRHPDMPADPALWVKSTRKQVSLSSKSATSHNRKVQQARTWN